MTQVVAAVDVVHKGLGAAKDALELHGKVMEGLMPREKFDEISAELKKYMDSYSEKAAEIVGKITTLLQNCRDEYAMVVQHVKEWCLVVSPLLNSYLALFDKNDEKKTEAQKVLILAVLNKGIEKMSSAQKQLNAASKSLNDASGNLVTLDTIFKNDFDRNSAWFSGKVAMIRGVAYGTATVGFAFGLPGILVSYGIAAGVAEGDLVPTFMAQLAAVKATFQDLQETTSKAALNIEDAKGKLRLEIEVIGDMSSKATITEAAVLVGAADVKLLKDSAKSLIEAADDYVKHHKTAMW